MPLETKEIKYLSKKFTIVNACAWCPESEYGSYYRCRDERGCTFWLFLPPSIVSHRRFSSGICPSCKNSISRTIPLHVDTSEDKPCRWCLELTAGMFCDSNCYRFFMDVHMDAEPLEEYGKEEL